MKYTDAQIVTELRRVYRQNGGKPFTRREYEAIGAISKTTIEKRFETWNAALDEAGLLSKFENARKKARKQAVTAKVKKKPARRTKA